MTDYHKHRIRENQKWTPSNPADRVNTDEVDPTFLYYSNLMKLQREQTKERVAAEKELSTVRKQIRLGLAPLRKARNAEWKRLMELDGHLFAGGTYEAEQYKPDPEYRPDEWTDEQEKEFQNAYELMRILRILETKKHKGRNLTSVQVIDILKRQLQAVKVDSNGDYFIDLDECLEAK